MKVYLKNIKENAPLIHNITNYVTVNDCANMILACGASPIMADDKREVEEITSICNALNINIGTLNSRTIESMVLAGKKANELRHPIVLDPVGVGASALRTQTALHLLQEIQFTVIRGNISEIKMLAGITSATQGVDANIADKVTENNLDATILFAKDFSKRTGAIIVITGAIDIVCNSEQAYIISNGHSMMTTITGTGCQLSALLASYVAVNTDDVLRATVAAVCTMGLAGEIAYERLEQQDGNASYRNYIIDAVFNMTPEQLEKGAKYEVR